MTTVVHISNYFDIYVGRPTKWGNPYSHLEKSNAKYKVNSRKEAVEKFKEYILQNEKLLNDLHELKDKVLGCHCKGKQECHGKVLAELVNAEQLKLF